MNITFGYGNVDEKKWPKFVADRQEVPPEFNEWIDNNVVPQAGYIWWRLGAHISRLRPIADLVRRAQEEDGYHAVGKIGDIGRIALVFPWEGGKAPNNGMYWGRADIDGKIDTLNAEHMKALPLGDLTRLALPFLQRKGYRVSQDTALEKAIRR